MHPLQRSSTPHPSRDALDTLLDTTPSVSTSSQPPQRTARLTPVSPPKVTLPRAFTPRIREMSMHGTVSRYGLHRSTSSLDVTPTRLRDTKSSLVETPRSEMSEEDVQWLEIQQGVIRMALGEDHDENESLVGTNVYQPPKKLISEMPTPPNAMARAYTSPTGFPFRPPGFASDIQRASPLASSSLSPGSDPGSMWMRDIGHTMPHHHPRGFRVTELAIGPRQDVHGKHEHVVMEDSLSAVPSRYIAVQERGLFSRFDMDPLVRVFHRGTSISTRGWTFAAYFDLRHAISALQRIMTAATSHSGSNHSLGTIRAIQSGFCSGDLLESLRRELPTDFVISGIGEGAVVQVSATSPGLNVAHLTEAMGRFGNIVQARMLVPDHPTSSHHEQWIQVEYFDVRDADSAVQQLDGTLFEGHRLSVQKLMYCAVPWPKPNFGAPLSLCKPAIEANTPRPAVHRARTSPDLRAIIRDPIGPPTTARHHASRSLDASAVTTLPDVTQLRREQQRLIEADLHAQQRHQVPLGNEINTFRIAQGLDPRTTCMLRNIPNKFSQKDMLEQVNKTHFGRFDFFYLRMDFTNKCNVGYAFINFVDAESIIDFIKHHVGKKWNTFGSDKVCRLSYANIQGRQALIDKFRNSAVMEKDASYRPMLFYTSGSKRGQEEPFPGPTMGGRRTSLDIALDDDEFMQPEYDMLDLGMRRWGDIPTVASKTERHLISNATREDATSNAGHQPE